MESASGSIPSNSHQHPHDGITNGAGELTLRTCTKCGESKPLDKFRRHTNRIGRTAACAACLGAADHARWLRIRPPPITLAARILAYVSPEPNTGCWLWLGSITTHGYGRMMVGRKIRHTHRLSHEVFKGPIPAGLFVLHSCHQRSCCNPDHLRAGTAQENSDDTVRANHSGRGERNAQAKLDNADVLRIRERLRNGERVGALAVEFGVHQSLISLIRSGKRWSHLVEVAA